MAGKMRKQILTGAGLLLLAAFTLLGPQELWAENRQDPLLITVVEDIPALDIEDNLVPLAAGPGASKAGSQRDGYRHAALMGLVLTAVIAGWLYFSWIEREMFLLRMRAARAEKEALEAISPTAAGRGPGKAGRGDPAP